MKAVWWVGQVGRISGKGEFKARHKKEEVTNGERGDDKNGKMMYVKWEECEEDWLKWDWQKWTGTWVQTM